MGSMLRHAGLVELFVVGRSYCDSGWWPATTDRALFDPGTVTIRWYRYRGTKIPTTWPITG
jgi:RNA-directed DNA polymerase